MGYQRIPLILWAAQLMASFIFVGVSLMLPPAQNAASPMLLVVLGIAALSSATMSFVIPSVTRKQALSNLRLDAQEQVVEDEPQLFRKAPKTRVVFSNPDKARKAAYVTGQAPFIISLALCESVAVLGFVLTRLGFDMLAAAPLFVLAWILFGLHFPSEKSFLAPLEKAKGAVFP